MAKKTIEATVDVVEKQKSKSNFVKMVRDESHPEPRLADVHIDEVDHYKLYGWEVA